MLDRAAARLAIAQDIGHRRQRGEQRLAVAGMRSSLFERARHRSPRSRAAGRRPWRVRTSSASAPRSVAFRIASLSRPGRLGDGRTIGRDSRPAARQIPAPSAAPNSRGTCRGCARHRPAYPMARRVRSSRCSRVERARPLSLRRSSVKRTLQRFGFQPRRLLLALQILEQRRQRRRRQESTRPQSRSAVRRDLVPDRALAVAQAGDRRLAQFLEAGRGPLAQGGQRTCQPLRLDHRCRRDEMPAFAQHPRDAGRARSRRGRASRVSHRCAHQPGATTPAP